VPISYAETNSTTTLRINAEADVYVEQNKPYENFEGTFYNYAGYIYGDNCTNTGQRKKDKGQR
jgi:hypothetical protein